VKKSEKKGFTKKSVGDITRSSATNGHGSQVTNKGPRVTEKTLEIKA